MSNILLYTCKGPKLEPPTSEQLRKVQQAQHNKFVRERILQ